MLRLRKAPRKAFERYEDPRLREVSSSESPVDILRGRNYRKIELRIISILLYFFTYARNRSSHLLRDGPVSAAARLERFMRDPEKHTYSEEEK